MTDHRIKLTLHKLDTILNGDLDEVIDSLIVTQGQDYLFHPCIGSHQVIEFLDSDGLRVRVMRFFKHMSVIAFCL